MEENFVDNCIKESMGVLSSSICKKELLLFHKSYMKCLQISYIKCISNDKKDGDECDEILDAYRKSY
jgi:hypothetical protein